MVDWFNAIRAARFHYLQVAFPGASDEEVRVTDLIIPHTATLLKMLNNPEVFFVVVNVECLVHFCVVTVVLFYSSWCPN